MQDNLWILTTLIFPTQDEAVETWEKLMKEWFAKGKKAWRFIRWNTEFQIWYDPDIIGIWKSVDIYEKMWAKKAKKKGIKLIRD